MKFKKLHSERTELFLGAEESYYSFFVEGISITDFKSVTHLKKVLDEDEFENLMNDFGFTKMQDYDSYLSPETELTVKYYFDEGRHKIVFVSCGEKNKGVFRIYLEGQLDVA